MLGGKPGQGAGLELGELADDGVTVGQALPEFLDVVFEAGDLGVSRVGDLPCGACPREALLEVVFEVGVGAIEGRAGDPGGGCERLDVAPAAGRQVATQELVGGGADAGLGLLALLAGQGHVSPS